MSTSSMQVTIVTPDAVVFEGSMYCVNMRALDGGLGIYPGHAHLVAALDLGEVTMTDTDGKEHSYACFGGFAQVTPEAVRIVAPACEEVSSIDRARAEAAKQRAEDRLASKSADIDMDRASLALKRALLRLQMTDRRL